ncbi:hypothetical protein HMPREF1044_1022 [Streptococcus constellatus subsp. constellatus SK53]|uniref:Uncharacterized protein n=1 Tax=Streptococcus constellatus subsp. constellatus SK53 TaxID=1095730 RepID=A0AAD2SW40_STRCV|nr:hypothetical protein HMPREF1044_1022 [Streptococcus constellatus subsp. constellatus SK53]BBD22330.1 hypothetical protein SCSC_0651 [Streptococcus constellatus subsp. constellatus]
MKQTSYFRYLGLSLLQKHLAFLENAVNPYKTFPKDKNI